MAEERSRDRSSSLAVRISVVGMTTIFAANNAVWMKGNHFALKTDPVSFARTGCLRCGLCKARPTLRGIDARPQRRQRQPRKPVKRPWTIPWRYTLRKRRYNYLPSVPSPRDRPRRNGRKPKPRPLNPLNPSPWLPASRRWDGPALTGRTAAGLGVQSTSEDTGTTNDRILRDISGHGVTAPGERASGHGQVPRAVPAPAGVPSPAVSPRRLTPIRRPLPLDIIIILRTIVDPFHQLHLGRLPTAGLRPVTREDERVPIGRVRRTSPDGMSSCLPRVPSLLRRERSRWSLRRPSRFMLNRPQKFKSRHRWRTARQVPTLQKATARTQVTARQHETARPQATARPQVTVRTQVTARPQGPGWPQWTTRPVTTQWMSWKLSQSYSLMNRTRRTAQHAIQQKEWMDRQDLEPRQLPRQGVDQTSPGLQGPAARFSLPCRDPSLRKTLVDFMSMWTLLQRRMDQSSVPVTTACPPDQSAAPAPRQDSTNRRAATPARTPERILKSPERFLHTPQSTVSSFLRRARVLERKDRTPVRQARTPVRQRSESKESRSRSPLSRSSSVESPARDESPVNFTAAMDPESKRDIFDDEGDKGDSKKISVAQYKIFRQAVSTSKGSYKVNPAKTKRASRASWLDLGDTEVTDRISWLDQPSLQDTMASTARIAQGLKEDEEVVKTTLSETLNSDCSSFKFFTVKQIFPREPYRLKIHRDALNAPKPPGDHGFSNNKAPSSYHMSHRVCLDTEELARRSAIYASLADSMVASVIEELSPKDERTKLLREKLAIIQEAQVSAVSAGFAAASNLQLLHRDALLKNFNFQPQVLSSVQTAPFEGDQVVGPEPEVLQNRVRAIRQADLMTGSSVTFLQKQREPNTSKKVTSSKKTAPRPSVFDRLGSPTSTPQRTGTQEPPFWAGAGRTRARPFQGSKKSGKASSATSTRQRWRVPGGGSPGRLCTALAESAEQLSDHWHRRGRGGHCIASNHLSSPIKASVSGPGTADRIFSKP